MIAGGMFYGDPPEFDLIVERLSRLEANINRLQVQ
jgi:hypothetical protein